MSYQALYRVWRPRNFVDVVGQSHITRTLQNAIVQEKFSHAYLFSGPRGTGKTSAAKIFAKTINCEHGPAKEACNECDACIGIQNGSIPDVIEMDGASNTRVDDIREIRDKVKYASSSVPYKVYIIDEVHMITTNAFNALLKTLEEPPPHVLFILATTEPHKIPLTVISRCQRFDFKPINNRTIAERIKTIMAQESFEMTQEAIEAVALSAEGGMRDALSILDQAISYGDGHVDIDDVLAVTGGVPQHILTTILEAMFQQDLKQTLHLFDSLMEHGKDPGQFVFDVIYFLRDLLFYKTTSDLEDYLERAIVDDSFKTLAKQVDVHWIQFAMLQFTTCEQQIKWTNSPKVFVEVAILSVTQRYNSETEQTDQVLTKELSDLQQKISQLEKTLTDLKNNQATGSHQEQTVQTRPREMPRRRSQSNFQIPTEMIKSVLDKAEKSALQRARTEWPLFLEQLKGTSPQAHATIQDSQPVAASVETIVVAFKYEIHCSLVKDHQQMIETMLSQILGTSISILAIPEQNWLQIRADYVKRQKSEQSQDDANEPKVVEKAKQLFGDELVEVKD